MFLFILEEKAPFASPGGSLGSFPPLIPVVRGCGKHVQMKQEVDFCFPSFLEKVRQLGSGLLLKCLCF